MSDKEAWKPLFERAKTIMGPEGDTRRLPKELRTVVTIVAAQGVIDNGGYRYFFENDWPFQPPYASFVEAYETIGCHAAAADLERIVATFPFPDPHLNCEARNQFMDNNEDEESGEIHGWGDALCGDDSIWTNLNTYCASISKSIEDE